MILHTLINTSIDEYMIYDPVISKKNPHVWMSPINAKDMTFKIYKKFVELNSENNATFCQNLLLYEKDINGLLTRINQTKAILNGTNVVVHHPAFLYFFDLLGLNRIGVIEEVEGSEPSAAHIAELTQKMIDEECDLIINQPQLDEEDVEALALSTDAKIAVLTPLLGVEVEKSLRTEFGGYIEEYIEMFDYNLYKLRHPYIPSVKNTPGFKSVSILSLIFIAIFFTTTRKKRKSS